MLRASSRRVRRVIVSGNALHSLLVFLMLSMAVLRFCVVVRSSLISRYNVACSWRQAVALPSSTAAVFLPLSLSRYMASILALIQLVFRGCSLECLFAGAVLGRVGFA
jgi:hypothetical protein